VHACVTWDMEVCQLAGIGVGGKGWSLSAFDGGLARQRSVPSHGRTPVTSALCGKSGAARVERWRAGRTGWSAALGCDRVGGLRPRRGPLLVPFHCKGVGSRRCASRKATRRLFTRRRLGWHHARACLHVYYLPLLQGRSSSVRPGSSNDHTSTQALCLWNEIERYWLQDS
jgi:hypothetical protein